MKKNFFRSILFAVIVFSNSIVAQQKTNTNFPGVPGACGFPKKQEATARGSSENPKPLDGINTLGNIYNVSKCGLNYIAVSQKLGQRFTPAGVVQPAPFSVSGLQICDSIEKAYLWVEGSGAGGPQTATIQPPSGPTQNFPMTLVGSGPDKCWGYPETVTYRADVTSIINGNGIYNLSGINTSPPMSQEDMDGATLVIIYSDHMATYQGTMVIDDGCIEVSGGVANYDMNYNPVCGATTNAKAFCCVGDLQMAIQSLTMNGTPAAFAWDWWNYVETSTTVNLAQSTSNFNLNTSGDCYNLCVVGLYYQTASCAICPLISPILSIATTSTTSSCPGCSGTATANPTPAGTYTYSWFPGGQTTQTATNLCAGIYTVSVTGGCMTQTTTVTVANAGALIAAQSQTNVSCFNGSNGTAHVIPFGGLGPYTFAWVPIGGNGATATGLSAGTYTCTITDANGCIYVNGFTITQPAGMSISVTIQNALCYGQTNGSASTAVTGGSPSYTYAWTPTGGNASTATGFAPGNYSVTVTDANGCSQIQPVVITQPAILSNVMTTIDVGCFASGSATATTSGGTGPYAYLWSDGGNSSTDINLTVGTYTVLITDANGCTMTDTAIINSTSGITTTSTFQYITCHGMNNGSGTVVSSGGNPPYTYAWSPSGGNAATAVGLSAGTYTCTITDLNGCISTATFVFTDPPTLTSISASTNVSCNGGTNGSGTISPTGGTGPYTFAWSPSGGTGQIANGLGAGNYVVTVTDAHGCITTQSITVTQPTAMNITTVGDSACMGQASTISANTSGGVGPYTYSWSNGPTTQSQNVNINTTTTFTVSVTDANNCVSTATTLVTVNPMPLATIGSNTINGVYTLNGPNSQLCFTGPTSGIVSWNWNLNNVGTSALQNPCVPVSLADMGQYCATLVVVNNHGCVDTSDVCLEINNVYYSIPNVFTPDQDGTNDGFVITNMGMKTLRCEIYNRWGELIYSWDSTTGFWDGKTKNGNPAVDGVYYYTVFMADFQDKTYNESGFVQLVRGK